MSKILNNEKRRKLKIMIKEVICQIAEIINDLSKVQTLLYSSEFKDCPDEYESLLLKITIQSEKAVCKLRQLIYSSTIVTKRELMKKVSDAHGIEVKYTDGIFTVTLPSLLPKTRKAMNSEFIYDPLYFALEIYCSDIKIEKFRECIVCFTHIYSGKKPKIHIRDYDNIEKKQVLDAIATFVMTDDSGSFCDVYNTTEYAEKDGTSVSVMSKNKFQEWLTERRLNLLKIQ